MSFFKDVYSLCRQIPKGEVTTYKILAGKLNVKAYQAIGNALKRNPFSPTVPCYRVVKSDGNIGGFKGMTKGKEITEKIRLLKSEGVDVIKGKIDLRRYLYEL